MKNIILFLSVFLLFAGSFVLQSSRIFSIGDVTPNLLLIFLLLIFFLRLPSWVLWSVPATFILFFLFSSPSWVFQIFILMITATALFFLSRKFFTGNPSFDFPLVVLVATPVFYLILRLAESVFFSGTSGDFSSLGFVLWETGYNVVIGGVVGLVFLRRR